MPSDGRTPTMREVIQTLIEDRLNEVRTWLPALVDSYDETKQLVDCTAQVGIPYRDPDDDEIKYDPAPRVGRCPVGFMGAGGFRMTFPIEPGKTTGVILFAESPIVEWLTRGGGRVTPVYSRRFDINDAMFIPMLKPHVAAFTDVPRIDAMTVGNDGGPQMVITKTEVQLGGTPSSPPTDFVALAPKVLDELKKIQSHFAAVEAIISGPPINEPGNGAPSQLQVRLQGALTASPYPSPSMPSSSNVKAK